VIEQQHPLGSGFGKDTTATEVLAGLDLTGRLAVVTGGYSGLGLEATRALSAAGAHVVVPARRPDAAKEALDGLAENDRGSVETDALDLGDQGSVAAFADRFLATDRAVDMMIDNAGIMATPETRVGPGWEAQFATNHLGHFALVNRLWPAIVRGRDARVVSVSSRGHHRSGVRFDDLDWRAEPYDKWRAYGQSKTANVLFALQLDRLGADQGVRAFSLHPGGIMTPLQRHLPREEMVALGWLDEDGNPTPEAAAGFKTPAAGAATEVWAATSPQLAGRGGLYLEDCEVAEVAHQAGAHGVRDYALDPDAAARLWAVSAERTGVDAFA
jgi:NAD(P)-dependent dehydrogenase (short-subunit alcohol dehydrogenase family)